MAGFLDEKLKSKREPVGMYAPLVGCYVKLVTATGPNFTGRVAHTDHRILELLPHLVVINLDYSSQGYVEKETPAFIAVESIQAIQPLKDGERVLDQIIKDLEYNNIAKSKKREAELATTSTTKE